MTATASPIRVSVPYDVASNLGKFKDAVGGILGKLGCAACCSGMDIHFDIERQFYIDDKINIRSFGQSARTMPAAVGLAPENTYVLDPAIAYSKADVMKAIDKIAARVGCPNCCSGKDIYFRQQRDFFVGGDAL